MADVERARGKSAEGSEFSTPAGMACGWGKILYRSGTREGKDGHARSAGLQGPRGRERVNRIGQGDGAGVGLKWRCNFLYRRMVGGDGGKGLAGKKRRCRGERGGAGETGTRAASFASWNRAGLAHGFRKDAWGAGVQEGQEPEKTKEKGLSGSHPENPFSKFPFARKDAFYLAFGVPTLIRRVFYAYFLFISVCYFE